MDCPHCDATFEEEAAYLRHLRDEHGESLGPIDRRRVASLEEDGSPRWLFVALGVGGVLLVAAGAGVLLLGGDDPSGIEAEPLPDSGDPALLDGVERFPSEGRSHVPAGREVDYNTTPPTSGPHYDGAVEAGFYEETPPLGELVHSLEHGAVVVYYDESALTPETRGSLEEWAAVHDGTYSSVIVVPHPEDDPAEPYVLTAWRTRLRVPSYDAEVVRAFLAEYLGRGPENPVR